MTVEQIVHFQHTQPFRPYRIFLADGRHFDVAHPDFLSRSQSGRTIIVHHGQETFDVIDLLLVTSLQVLNGKRPTRKP